MSISTGKDGKFENDWRQLERGDSDKGSAARDGREGEEKEGGGRWEQGANIDEKLQVRAKMVCASLKRYGQCLHTAAGKAPHQYPFFESESSRWSLCRHRSVKDCLAPQQLSQLPHRD